MIGYPKGVSNTFNKLAGRTSLVKLSSHTTGQPSALNMRRKMES